MELSLYPGGTGSKRAGIVAGFLMNGFVGDMGWFTNLVVDRGFRAKNPSLERGGGSICMQVSAHRCFPQFLCSKGRSMTRTTHCLWVSGVSQLKHPFTALILSWWREISRLLEGTCPPLSAIRLVRSCCWQTFCSMRACKCHNNNQPGPFLSLLQASETEIPLAPEPALSTPAQRAPRSLDQFRLRPDPVRDWRLSRQYSWTATATQR